jgi:hypothetical protein
MLIYAEHYFVIHPTRMGYKQDYIKHLSDTVQKVSCKIIDLLEVVGNKALVYKILLHMHG